MGLGGLQTDKMYITLSALHCPPLLIIIIIIIIIIGDFLLSILTQFPSNRSQPVMVGDCWSKLVNFRSGVLQGGVFSPLLFLMYT